MFEGPPDGGNLSQASGEDKQFEILEHAVHREKVFITLSSILESLHYPSYLHLPEYIEKKSLFFFLEETCPSVKDKNFRGAWADSTHALSSQTSVVNMCF